MDKFYNWKLHVICFTLYLQLRKTVYNCSVKCIVGNTVGMQLTYDEGLKLGVLLLVPAKLPPGVQVVDPSIACTNTARVRVGQLFYQAGSVGDP
jgi:hypothetical protein